MQCSNCSRAVVCRQAAGYDTLPVALAVVIRKMVNSDASGVLFTRNPTKGRASEILINASYGLGESVVSGAVSPDELICQRNGRIMKQTVGSKETMVVYGEKRTVTVPVEEEQRKQLCR